jgi:hypothetical protein
MSSNQVTTEHVTTAPDPVASRHAGLRRAAVALAIGALLLVSVASVAARTGGGRTLTVIFHGEAFTSTQADPASISYRQGDQIYLGASVLRFASPHDRIGEGSLWCAATGLDGSALTCLAAFSLPGGKITTETLFETNGDWSQPTRKLAITGGTGAYRNARGELTVTTQASGDEVGVFSFAD